MSDSECNEQMKKSCERIRDVIEALSYSNNYYDSETGEIVSGNDIHDLDEDERYLSLSYYLEDNLGVKVLTDLEGETMYSCKICFAWGGPNIYVDTETRAVEGYWGFDEVSVPLSGKACDAIDDCINELRECYR